jgi:cell division protein FtsW
VVCNLAGTVSAIVAAAPTASESVGWLLERKPGVEVVNFGCVAVGHQTGAAGTVASWDPASGTRALLLLAVGFLAMLGLWMVPSASVTSRPSLRHQELLVRQAAFLTGGTLVSLWCSRWPARRWYQLAPGLYLASILAVGLLLVPGVGPEINGAHRWYQWGPFTLQPAEHARVAVLLFTARWLNDLRTHHGWSLQRTLAALMPGSILVGLMALQPDFGGAMLLACLLLLQLFLAGIPLWQLATVGLLVATAGVTLILAEPYRWARLVHLVDSWTWPQQAPYQVRQSLLAWTTGGLWGVGLGRGWQKLGFLPESNTDFIFAVLAEELGSAVALAVLACWVAIAWCGYRLSRCETGFRRLAALSLTLHLVLQAFTHMGVALACLPPKGIGLPFVSYGGSNLTASLWSIGLIYSLTRPAGGHHYSDRS